MHSQKLRSRRHPRRDRQGPHGQRAARSIALSLSALLLLSGCSWLPGSGPDRADRFGLRGELATDDRPYAAPLERGEAVAVTVQPAEPLRERAARFVLAGRAVEAFDGDEALVLPQRRGTAALLTAEDEDGAVLATALSIDLPGVDRGGLRLDGTSTAMTRVLTTSPLLTSNPGAVLAGMLAVLRSPSFKKLAELHDLRLQQGTPLTAPDDEETGLAERVVADALQQLSPDAAARGRVIPFALSARPAPLPPRPECVDEQSGDASAEVLREVFADGSRATGLCIGGGSGSAPRDVPVGTEPARVVNESPSWAVLLRPGRSDRSAAVAVVPAESTTLPGASKVLDAGTDVLVQIPAASIRCGIEGLVGLLRGADEEQGCDGEEYQARLDEATEAGERLVEGTSPGRLDLLLDGEALSNGLAVVTAGRDLTSVVTTRSDFQPYLSVGVSTGGWADASTFFTAWTHVLRPLLELFAGETFGSDDRTGSRRSYNGAPVGALFDAFGNANNAGHVSRLRQAVVEKDLDGVLISSAQLLTSVVEDPRTAAALSYVWGFDVQKRLRQLLRVQNLAQGQEKGRIKGSAFALDALAYGGAVAYGKTALSQLDLYARFGAFESWTAREAAARAQRAAVSKQQAAKAAAEAAAKAAAEAARRPAPCPDVLALVNRMPSGDRDRLIAFMDEPPSSGPSYRIYIRNGSVTATAAVLLFQGTDDGFDPRIETYVLGKGVTGSERVDESTDPDDFLSYLYLFREGDYSVECGTS